MVLSLSQATPYNATHPYMRYRARDTRVRVLAKLDPYVSGKMDVTGIRQVTVICARTPHLPIGRLSLEVTPGGRNLQRLQTLDCLHFVQQSICKRPQPEVTKVLRNHP